MIKHIFLDLDDTILDFHGAEGVAIVKAFKELGIPTDEGTIAEYKRINRACWESMERGEIERERVLTRRFEILFEKLGISLSPEKTQETYAYRLGCEHSFLPGGKELLDELSGLGKYKLYIASNGIYRVQKPRIDASGIARYFEDIFISEKIGYNKPSAEFFDICFSKIRDFKKEECIIVGDSLSSDILGGKNAGILTCFFNPHGKAADSIIPDYEIRELSELVPILNSIK